MSDAVWYYAEGDRQKGPVAAEELKRLVVLGRVKPTDLVWQPGMDDWVPAQSIRGLVPDDLRDESGANPRPAAIDAGFEDVAIEPQVMRRRRRPLSLSDVLPAWNFQVIARGVVLAGLLLIIAGRGGESLSAKLARRQQVVLDVAKSDLEADFRKRRLTIQTKLIAAQRSDAGTPQSQQTIADYQQQLAQVDREYTDRQNQLSQTTWLDMDIASRAALSNHIAAVPWYEAYAMFGAVLVAIGSLVLGFLGTSVERWGSWMLLAVLLAGMLWTRTAGV
jgi:hypothetical protein